MRYVLFLSYLAAAVLGLGCAVTDYPVIFDTRGADNAAVLQSVYDKAYIVPEGQIAELDPEGSHSLYTEVTQDWMGDQWLYTYDNFDPTATVIFLDQTYCDPVRQSNCAVSVSWNPNTADDVVWDYEMPPCGGFDYVSALVTMDARIGECGSGIFSRSQAAAYEFSLLQTAPWRGKDWYVLPIDAENSTFTFTSTNGHSGTMPVFGTFRGYIDEQLRIAFPVTPNAKYQLRWLKNFTDANGAEVNMNVVYGSLSADYKLKFVNLDAAMARY